MKVEPTITVTVSGRTAMRSLFEGIKKGAEVQARVVERVGARDAVIEIGGRRIHAQFMKGVPAGGAVTLKLDAVSGDSYYFKLTPPETREGFIRQVMQMTVFDPAVIRKKVLHDLGGALAKHPAGIFELNALLLNRPLRDTKDDGLSRFLNHLAKRGLDKSALADLSLLLSGMSARSHSLRSLLLVLGFGEDRIRRLAAGGTAAAGPMTDAILEEIGSIDDGEAKENVIRQLLEFLTGGDMPREAVRSGEFTFIEGDGFHPARYCDAGDAWLFSVDFSAIGRLEIVARETDKELLVSVFCDRDEALDILKSGSGELIRTLENLKPHAVINFFNTQQAINKIVEIYSYYSLNSEFDIRA